MTLNIKECLLIKKGFAEAKAAAKKHAKTFYFASFFLPKKTKRAAYCAYAVCRMADEAVDSSSSKEQSLNEIRKNIDAVYADIPLNQALLAAFRDTVNRYKIPRQYFDELAEGMRMDLYKNRYLNFNELHLYCYRAAGVVGLIMLKILGYSKQQSLQPAIDLGIALQLTNILRDIKEDYLRGRIYLPADELKHFGITEKDIAEGKTGEKFTNLLKLHINRAREYYKNSAGGIRKIKGLRQRFVIIAMKDIYSAILKEIEKNNYDIFNKRVYVKTFDKFLIALKIFLKGEFI